MSVGDQRGEQRRPVPPSGEAACTGDFHGLRFPEGFVLSRSTVYQSFLAAIARVSRAMPHTVVVMGPPGSGRTVTTRILHASDPRGEGNLRFIPCADIEGNAGAGTGLGASLGAFREEIVAHPGAYVVLTGFLDGDRRNPAELRRLRDEIVGWGTGRVIILITDSATTAGDKAEDAWSALAGEASIRVPALEDRREDIPELALHFLHRANVDFRKHLRGIEFPALELLRTRGWKRNVQELELVIRDAVLSSSDGSYLKQSDLRLLGI